MKQVFKSSLTGFLGSLFLLTASTLGASGASAEEYNADVGQETVAQHKDSGVPENHAVDEVLNFVEGAGTENPYFNTKAARSEERRVGKECRSRWAQEHEKKKKKQEEKKRQVRRRT